MENYGILLVDDEPVYRAIVPAMLSPYGAIDIASTGAEALKLGKSRVYDLILMDIELGGQLDGYALTEKLRAEPGWAGTTPIVAFTTIHPAEGESHFIDRGFDGWLPKPFTAADVHRVAARWTGSAVAPAGGLSVTLAQLLGQEVAGQMVDRLHASLADAIDAIEQGASPASFGHRLGGLAGTLGYAPLAAGWLALQYGDLTGWKTVRALTLEAIAAHRRQRGAA